MKKRILFVGEHPYSHTGNAGMLQGLLETIDRDEYEFAVFAIGYPTVTMHDSFFKSDFNIVQGSSDSQFWGQDKLLSIISTHDFHILMFVGIDIWRYAPILGRIREITKSRNIAWVHLFPYDAMTVRKDWVKWINMVEYPCVYSQYGFDMLKDHVANLIYFRPRLHFSEQWRRLDPDERQKLRGSFFPQVHKDTTIFGFFGCNQYRKDPLTLIKAFSIFKKEIKKQAVLYLHTEASGEFNIQQYAFDCGLETGDIIIKSQKEFFAIERMVQTYNSVDCMVNCSLQEGLSWTIIEAMLCGLPVIASDTTAQRELLRGGVAISVENTERAYIPIYTGWGDGWIESRRVSAENLAEAMGVFVYGSEYISSMPDKAQKFAIEWIKNVSDINVLFDRIQRDKKTAKPVEKKIDAILFAQHSSAGDVLMTTQCLKELHARHGNMKFDYMTQEKYFGIVDGNPYVDELIPWDESLLRKYKVVYNPHGEHILNGRFNTLDVKLHSMYPYFCKVKPDEMYLNKDFSDVVNQFADKKIVLVHTSGASPYRIYMHIDVVLSGIEGYTFIQIGSLTDAASNRCVDMRGVLSFAETAALMSKATAFIAVDSYPAHLAGACGTPGIVLFGPAPARVTGPRNDKNNIVCMEPNRLDVCHQMGLCYGQSPTCERPCINTINPMSIRAELIKILEANG